MLKVMKDLLLTYKSGGIAAADALYLPPWHILQPVIKEIYDLKASAIYMWLPYWAVNLFMML